MAKHRAKFGWPLLSDVSAVMKPRCETRWNSLGCPKPANRSQPLGGPKFIILWGHVDEILVFDKFFRLSIHGHQLLQCVGLGTEPWTQTDGTDRSWLAATSALTGCVNTHMARPRQPTAAVMAYCQHRNRQTEHTDVASFGIRYTQQFTEVNTTNKKQAKICFSSNLNQQQRAQICREVFKQFLCLFLTSINPNSSQFLTSQNLETKPLL